MITFDHRIVQICDDHSFAIYTWYSYVVLVIKNEERQKRMYKAQTTCMFLIHLDAFMVLFAVTKDFKILIFYGAQVLFVLFLFLIYRIIYKRAARLVVNHMCMLLLVGFIILTRLNFENAIRQFEIAVVAAVVSAFVPILVRKLKFFTKIYLVLLCGRRSSTWYRSGAWKNERRCTSFFHGSWYYVATVRICKNYICIFRGMYAL